MASYLRTPEETWLQRHARPILVFLSSLGVLLTAYLTYTKLTEQPAAFCGGDGGCNLVLSSRWAEFLGIPTAAIGLLGFLAVLALAGLPEEIPGVKRWRWPALFGLVSAMTVFEMYMLYLMVAVLRQFCLYCTAAMGLVAGLWLVTVFGHRWLDWAKLAFSYILVGLFTLVVTLGVYAKQAPPPSPLAAGLAAHLRKIGATMYGAYWCPHCQEQKALFGSAFAQIPYVECSPNGPGTPQVEECTKAGITSYPTWIINGRSYVGLRSLEALAVASGYSLEAEEEQD
jgi:uncharacterized membrane protein/glutaredoxin